MKKTPVQKTDPFVHKNHRERMRKKYLKVGLDKLEPHEVLEMLLYYVFPRQDTNPIAHNLINTFGSFHGVLEADVEDLMQVDGIGPAAAIFIKLFPDVRRFYETDRQKNRKSFNNLDEIGDYLLPGFMGRKNEIVMMLTLNHRNEPISTHFITEGRLNAVAIDIKKIVIVASRDNAAKIVIAHNHPGGLAGPSRADVNTTMEIKKVVQILGMELLDHFVYADDEYISMTLSNLIPKSDSYSEFH